MSRIPHWAAALPAAIVATGLLAQGLRRGPNLDAGVFLQIAEQLLAGAIPYRDLFDHKPPGIYLAEAGVGLLAPGADPWARAWTISLVAGLATLLLLASRLAPRSPAGATLALLAVSPMLGAFPFAQSGGYTESLAILPATAGLLVATGRPPRVPARAVVAGVLMGCAVATSLHLAPAALGGLAAVSLAGGRRAGLGYLAGGGAVAAVVGAWLAAVGALPAAFEQIVVYNRAYVEGQSLLDATTLGAIVAMAIMVGPALAGAILRLVELARSRSATPEEIGAAIWLVGACAFILVQGRYFGHYVAPLAAPLAILASPVLARFAAAPPDGRTRWASIGVTVLSFAVPLFFVVRFEPPSDPRQPATAAAAAVAAVTAPGDRIFVWGNEAQLYLLSNRDPASAYLFLFPLMQPRYTSPAMVGALLDDWLSDPPAAIVDAADHPTGPSAVPLLGERDSAMVREDLLDPLRHFVRSRYRIGERVGGWTIYVLA